MTTWIAALVVEDEALVRFDLTQSLQAEGYETFEAADAAEAIAVMEAHPEIRVVFTDIQMPGTMDGLAVALRAKTLAAHGHRCLFGKMHTARR